MLTHRGFSAWIVVDGTQVPEYLVAVDNDTNRVSCWIPGEEGQRFSVYWRDHGGKVDTCAFITLDGFVVPGRFLFGEGMACREGVRTSRTTERPFVFQKIQEDGKNQFSRVYRTALMRRFSKLNFRVNWKRCRDGHAAHQKNYTGSKQAR